MIPCLTHAVFENYKKTEASDHSQQKIATTNQEDGQPPDMLDPEKDLHRAQSKSNKYDLCYWEQRIWKRCGGGGGGNEKKSTSALARNR